MTIEQGGEAAELETTEAAHEAAVSSGDEALARKLGWVPEDEFKGERRPAKFKTAQEYIDDTPPSVLKIAERLEKDFEGRLARIEKMGNKTVKLLQAQHEQEISTLKADRRVAAKAGDEAEVERISEKIEQAQNNGPDKDEVHDVNEAFAKRNDWYGTDEELTAIAIGISQDVLAAYSKAHPGKEMPPEDMFDAVEKKVKATTTYKAKTKTPGANGHASVDGGSDSPAPAKGDPLASLPAEARAQAKEDMKNYPKIYPTTKAWVDAYKS